MISIWSISEICFADLHTDLLLDRVVLPDVCLDLLHNWPVLNLGKGLGVTDGASAS